MNWILVLFPLTWKIVFSICGSFGGTTCCSGSFWNKEKLICEKCPLGYHSFNCSEICTFPNFGYDCQGICICNLSLCDHRFGCKDSSGFLNDRTTIFVKNASKNAFETTEQFTKVETGKPIGNPSVPNVIFHIITVLVGIFLIIFSLFVGVYFYKHCLKPNNIIPDGKEEPNSNSKEWYKSLSYVENNQADENLRDSTYLDPIIDGRPHYVEIENQEELNEPSVMPKQNEEIVQLSLRSKSCYFLVHKPNDVISMNVKQNLFNNSL